MKLTFAVGLAPAGVAVEMAVLGVAVPGAGGWTLPRAPDVSVTAPAISRAAHKLPKTPGGDTPALQCCHGGHDQQREKSRMGAPAAGGRALHPAHFDLLGLADRCTGSMGRPEMDWPYCMLAYIFIELIRRSFWEVRGGPLAMYVLCASC